MAQMLMEASGKIQTDYANVMANDAIFDDPAFVNAVDEMSNCIIAYIEGSCIQPSRTPPPTQPQPPPTQPQPPQPQETRIEEESPSAHEYVCPPADPRFSLGLTPSQNEEFREPITQQSQQSPQEIFMELVATTQTTILESTTVPTTTTQEKALEKNRAETTKSANKNKEKVIGERAKEIQKRKDVAKDVKMTKGRGKLQNKGEKVLEESETDELIGVTKRTKTKRKFKNLPVVLRSPFWTKYNDKLKDKVSEAEKLISDYAFEDALDGCEPLEALFEFQEMITLKENFLSLRSDEIDTAILNAWAVRMNYVNMRRDPSEIKCIYFTTNPYLTFNKTSVWAKNKSEEQIHKDFTEIVDDELNKISLDISDAKLVFFPVLKSENYFLICFSFMPTKDNRQNKLYILDNKLLPEGISFSSNYQDCDQYLKRAFESYLRKKRMINIANRVRDAVTDNLKMYWKIKENIKDCGVYYVRHMETFKEGDSRKWTCGFSKDEKKDNEFIQTLRAKYAANIILMHKNEKKKEITDKVKATYKKMMDKI